MCKYCEDGKKDIFDYEEFEKLPQMDCHIDKKILTNEYSLVVDNAVSCEINYCPMCGRNLKEE